MSNFCYARIITIRSPQSKKKQQLTVNQNNKNKTYEIEKDIPFHFERVLIVF